MGSRPRILSAVIATLLGAVGPALAQTPVTGCNQGILGDAILMADLLCDGGGSNDGVTIERGTLDLNGHTIDCGGAQRSAISCIERCRIVGPGTVTNCAAVQGAVVGGERLDLIEVNVVDNPTRGVSGTQRRIVIEGSTISRNGIIGVYPTKRLIVRRSVIDDNAGVGILLSDDSSLPGKSRGTLKDSVIAGNGADGVYSDVPISILNSAIEGNVVDPGNDWCLDAGEGQKRAFADLQAATPLRLLGATLAPPASTSALSRRSGSARATSACTAVAARHRLGTYDLGRAPSEFFISKRRIVS